MANLRSNKTKRRAKHDERIPFWRTVGLVIVVVAATGAIGFFAAVVLVTLDEVQRWAPLSTGYQRPSRD